MSRVLKKGGGFWIGTPNKSRIIGYIGSKDTSFKKKVQWNVNDWQAKLSGKFENELGAHAGFSLRELCNLLKQVFPVVNDMTEVYFSELYKRRGHQFFLKFINLFGLSLLFYPSVYFIGTKSRNCNTFG